MNYNVFKEKIIEDLKERFDDSYDFEYKNVTKNNGIILDGLMAKQKDCNISPTIYVNDCYEDYKDGLSLDEICDHLEQVIIRNKIDDNFDTENFIKFDNIKDKIAFKVVNYEKNIDLLKNIPYKKFLDLAVVYYIYLTDEQFDNGSILINNSHLVLWDKDFDEIDKIAMANTPKLLKAEVKSMADTLLEFINSDTCIDINEKEMLEECNMFVISNERKHFGASVVLYDDVFKDFADKLQSDMYILPSSVHELIVIPSYMVDETKYLDEMIKEVNETQVPAIDILSDHAYYYSLEKQCILNASAI